jgi:hypothetical protein
MKAPSLILRRFYKMIRKHYYHNSKQAIFPVSYPPPEPVVFSLVEAHPSKTLVQPTNSQSHAGQAWL